MATSSLPSSSSVCSVVPINSKVDNGSQHIVNFTEVSSPTSLSTTWSCSNLLTIEYLRNDLAAGLVTIPSVQDENNNAFVAQRLLDDGVLLLSTKSDDVSTDSTDA